jgi:hypothetical protein
VRFRLAPLAVTAATVYCTFAPAPVAAAAIPQADVLIQAGHEGRPDCDREPAGLCNNTGASAAPGEIVWTPIVADEAARVLRASGVSVLREPAALPPLSRVKAAVFLHFDGNASPCTTGASVGYPAGSQSLADAWIALYRRYFPFAVQPGNFTDHLAHYYGYKHVEASAGTFLIEFGEMSCPRQNAWLKRHLIFLGDLVAYDLSKTIGKGNVPLPSPARP